MYMLQLFDADDATRPIDARLLGEGVLSLGRDPASDWPIADPECAISRAHCELHAGPDGLSIRALGANGVFDADDRRLPDGELTALEVPGALRLGRFRLVARRAPDAPEGGEGRTLILGPPLGASVEVPDRWADAGAAPAAAAGTPAIGGSSLLEAFCEGAELDSSQLSGERPEEIMRRAGALYRQMVLGIGDLMAERTRARSHYHLARTTIGGEGNNPFKWAPSQRLAIDLLLAGSSSFLPGPAALKASFRDVKRHLVATFAGFQGALRHAVGSFAPESLDAPAARGNLLKSRGALQAEEAARRHADLTAQLDGRSGSLERAFVAAYDAADAQLGRGETA